MNDYPALLDLATQQLHPLGNSAMFEVGRNESANLCVRDPACSRQHFRIVQRGGRFFVERLNAANPTFHNSKPVASTEEITHGSVLQAGQSRFTLLLHPSTPTAPQQPTPPAAQSFPLSGVMLIGRDSMRAQILLPHPQVSRRHASIALRGNAAVLTDLGSANGTFVNGRRIQAPTTLRSGDQLDIGPYALQFTGTHLKPRTRSDNVELVARGVGRVVRNRETGKPLPLLDEVSLVIRPHEFVCLLGPSGSGKSTLLSILSGRTSPDAGVVLVNERDLHANFEALKQDIAVVPQKDVLHDSLSVGYALKFTARLRLPPDTSSREVNSAVSEMLTTVGLTERRATVIRHLSGGQIKRASLANEILCKPTLLFLDEVTSGLDEQTDREVMDLFRSLADTGKTVVCITHSLANVERACHLVVILTPGGKLAFIGTPPEALTYFGITRLGDVYDRLKDQTPAAWQQKFRTSPYWKQYVVDRLPPDSSRATVKPRPRDSLVRRLWCFIRQSVLLTIRYTCIWCGDRMSLLAIIWQALLVAGLLWLVFGDISELDTQEKAHEHAARTLNLLFLLAVSSFWFGCNNAAKEIVKERTIFRRERDFNLMPSAYYVSKLLLLTAISWLQVCLLYFIVRVCCGPPGQIEGQVGLLLSLAFTGVTLGLAISSLAPSEETAIALIPSAVIPQIILSGAIAPLDGWAKQLALVGISTYWCKRGLEAGLPSDVANAVLPEALTQYSESEAIWMLLLHAAVCIVVALVGLRLQGQWDRIRNFFGRR